MATIQTVPIPRALIKNKLGELRHSMKDLAHATGIPYNTMNQYLNGYIDQIPIVRMNIIINQIEEWER